MKLFISGCVVVVLAFVVLIHADSNQWGRRVPGDRLLNSTTIVNNSLPVPIKSTVYQHQPPPGAIKAPKLSYIVARDNSRPGMGGFAALISGGINQTRAAVKLTSRPNLGFNFTVDVYGKWEWWRSTLIFDVHADYLTQCNGKWYGPVSWCVK